jgi:hypothetical protein
VTPDVTPDQPGQPGASGDAAPPPGGQPAPGRSMLDDVLPDEDKFEEEGDEEK